MTTKRKEGGGSVAGRGRERARRAPVVARSMWRRDRGSELNAETPRRGEGKEMGESKLDSDSDVSCEEDIGG